MKNKLKNLKNAINLGIKNSVKLCATFVLLCVIIFPSTNLTAQDTTKQTIFKNMLFNGYVKEMTTLSIPPSNVSGQWLGDNLLHNRLNYKWFINKNVTFETAMRNRFFWGEITKLNYILNPNYEEQMSTDGGWLDLTHVWSADTSYMLQTTFDRLSFQFTLGKFEAKIGRQRINWGTSLVWNPNDIFNAYSLFDFDYEERPGADAVALKYYTGASSDVEFVYQIADSVQGSSIAAKYKFNKKGYDWQAFAGWQKRFWVVGGGWAGEIKGAGFRGELTQFVPAYNYMPFNSQLVATVDLDYSFKNSLNLQVSYLYNSEGIDTKTGNYGAFFLNRELSAQALSPSMHSIYAGAGYQFMPMLFANFFSILNPSDGSFFVGPMVNYTVSNSFEVMYTSQFFVGETQTAYGGYGSVHYLRFKLNF